MCHLSIVVPVFQEARRLPQTLPQLAAALESLDLAHEVILVVEPGNDNSPEEARDFAAGRGWRVLLPAQHRGKGGAVRTGMLAARGRIVCFMDADMSTDLQALAVMLERFDASPRTGVVIGDRRHGQSVIVHRQSLLRQSLGRLFNRFVRLLFPCLKMRDTQCGFKALRHEVAQQIFARQQLDGFAFDVEVLALAAQLSIPVETIPVRWADSGRSSVRLWRHGSLMVADLLRLRFLRGFQARARPQQDAS